MAGQDANAGAAPEASSAEFVYQAKEPEAGA